MIDYEIIPKLLKGKSKCKKTSESKKFRYLL
jgi:hypothetical protein